MKHTIRFGAAVSLAVSVALLAFACTKDTSNSPSNSTTTVATTTIATTSTTSTTTSVQAVFTVSGKVTSDKDGSVAQFPVIEIIQGANIGKRFTGNQDGTYSMPGLSGGAFVARYWSPGFLIKDVLITLTTSNLTQDVQLTPAPPTTTTSVSAGIHASFTWSPDPCTIGNGGVNCTVDASGSTGFRSAPRTIVTYHWAYAGKDVFNQTTLALSFGCGNLLGSGVNRTLSVRLTVVDENGGADSIDQGVPVTIQNNVCP
jgi:hypothetical protein